MGSDSMKPKYNFEPFYTAIFLFREECIRGPKAPMDVQELVWFTDGSGTEYGTEAGIYRLKTWLLFSLGKEIYNRRLWRGASLSIGGSVGEPGGVGVVY
jgi:hypothetical protein